MKIIKITIHNFLKLKDVQLDPQKTNIILGKNKQGKTSILKAIETAFTGKADANSIHAGADKAEIMIDLDEYKIKRQITKSGNRLEVSTKNDWKVPAPQTFLDNLIGKFSFNPVDFFNLKGSEKKKYLLNAIDIRITQEKLKEITGENHTINLDRHALEVIKDLHSYYYEKRTVVNADVNQSESFIRELLTKIPAGFSPEQVNTDKVNQLRSAITENEVAKNKQKQCLNYLFSTKQEITNLENELEAIKKRLITKKDDLKILEKQSSEFNIKDTAELEKELSEIESKREFVLAYERIQETKKELEVEKEKQTYFDDLVKKLAKEVPDQLVREANLPVEGLGIGENNITLNGIDIDNLSSSEQLKFALEITKKLNDKFQIINIDGIETLDKENFEWFLKAVENDDYQYFVTRVDGDGSGWLVENGEVTKK